MHAIEVAVVQFAQVHQLAIQCAWARPGMALLIRYIPGHLWSLVLDSLQE